MCGIAGAVDFQGHADSGVVSAMTRALVHRGPDGEGYHASRDKTACLGHRRLAIIDVGGGDQPLSNEDGSVWVTFNGEIYNYIEIRAWLESRGHRFTTRSDTEVIVHAYEEDGPDCVDRFRGMFAFALHDERRRGLLLATDRLGKKPLYYEARGGPSLRFASELKALRSDAQTLTLDRTALGLYLVLGYIPPPYSIFSEIRKMRPAERIWFDADGLRQDTYWDLDYSPIAEKNEDQTLEELEAILAEAVKIRLRSDVPLGVLLSGGLDSSVIAARAAAEVPGSIRTFSIAFRERAFDESQFSRAVASHIGAEHVEVLLEPGREYVDILEDVVEALDEPFAVPSVVPTTLIAREIGHHCKVVLSGDGGDEGFAGYRQYWDDRWVDPLRRSDLLRSAGRAALQAWPIRRGRGPLRRLGLSDLDYVRGEDDYPAGLLVDPDAIAPEDETVALLDAEYGPPPASGDWDRVSRMQYVDTRRLYLPGHILVKTDRASMMSGVEVRSPLLDVPLLERLARVPVSLKVRGGTPKYLLKKIAAAWLPHEIVSRPKRGFNLPISEWFRGPMAGFVRERLLDSAELGSLVQPSSMASLIDPQRKPDDYQMLYRLVVLSIWLSRSSRAVEVA